MIKLTIDGKKVKVEEGLSLIQACEIAGVEIPRFCYHDKLKVAGNCRMCLVEVEKNRKPVASCAVPVAEGMVVKTSSEMVRKAREGVMEFLLINHPLDCPICDQGGECDLQDQAMAYGKSDSRFDESKRSVKDKNMGPLIKTHMTRCIHCTRCIRFSEDIAGTSELGGFGRGENAEISTYVESAIHSELSGNMIDICPVGALTSKPYAFKARSWELKKTESIDVLDAVGSNIRIDSRGAEVMRILPRLNEDINEEWISDKTRFAYDGLKNQRLDSPYIKVDGKLVHSNWDDALDFFKTKMQGIKPQEIGAIVGDLADAESIMVMKDIMDGIRSSNIDCMQEGASFDITNRSSYLFNTSVSGIEDSDLCLIIGANPRYEATMINARLRKRWMSGNYPVYVVNNTQEDFTYPYSHLGADVQILEEILQGSSKAAKDLLINLKKSKNPMMILGYGVFIRDDWEQIINLCSKIVEKYGFIHQSWNGFNVLHRAASRVAALDLGFVPNRKKGGKNVAEMLDATSSGVIKALYLLGADEIDTSRLKNDAFIIYQGHHGDKAAQVADLILPGCAYTEKSATYVNLEGRVQRTAASVQPPGEAKEDWRILKCISEQLGISLKYSDIKQLRSEMESRFANFRHLGCLKKEQWKKSGKEGKLSDVKMGSLKINYYLSDPISRSSGTMAKCADEFMDV